MSFNFNLSENQTGMVTVPFPVSKEKWKHMAIVSDIEIIKVIKKDASGNKLAKALPEYKDIPVQDLTPDQVTEDCLKKSLKFTFKSVCGTYTFEYIVWDLNDADLIDSKKVNIKVGVNNRLLAQLAMQLCGTTWNKPSEFHSDKDVAACPNDTYGNYLEYIGKFFLKGKAMWENNKFVLHLVRNDYSKNKNDLTFPDAGKTNIIERYEEGKKSILVQDIAKYSYDMREDTSEAASSKIVAPKKANNPLVSNDDDWPTD